MSLWRKGLAMMRCKRQLLFGIGGWSLLVLLVFYMTAQDSSRIISDSVHPRLLLQKVIETRGPITPTVSLSDPRSFLVANLEPRVDRARSEDEIALELRRQYPNVPVELWVRTKGETAQYGKNKTCAVLPSMYDIEFNNVYWQVLRTSNGTFHLYGAYYDIRPLVKLKPVVRILGMIDRIAPTIKTFCHVWYEDSKEPLILPVMEYKYIWVSKWGNYKQGILQPYLISCKVPNAYSDQVPVAVSLVEQPCDTARNHLRVIFDNPDPEEKKDFAVCVKGLDFLHEDHSVRMVEWLELLSILGADKVYLYELAVHPNITKVLRYYQDQGLVDLTPITLPGWQPNIPGFLHMYLKKKVNNKRQNELIPYNDCLYRNMYRYKYIALLDTDEVIMPIAVDSWKELMEDIVLPKALAIKNETRASYNVRNVYFLDDHLHQHGWFKDVPKYMHMLQHVYRSLNYTKPGQYVKCFHNPERVLTLHNHFPLACLEKSCTSYPINTTDAHLQHYRADCVGSLKKSCMEYKNHTMMDTAIWRYKEELIARTTKTLSLLGFFNGKPANEDLLSLSNNAVVR